MPADDPDQQPTLGEEEAAAARQAILSGWVTQGPQVAAFEEEFAAYVGAPHACAVSSCTTALHLALHALGVGPGDEVVTVSHSFIATANAVRYCGATPGVRGHRPADLQHGPRPDRGGDHPAHPGDHARAPDRPALRPGGHPGRSPSGTACRWWRTRPVPSAARSAIGERWERIGRPHGTVACFSFHPRKVITTGDGGMLTTRDPELDRKFRLLRQHGMSVPDTARHAAKTVIFEEYPDRRVQLPDDRHPGGGRPGAAPTPAGDAGPARRPGGRGTRGPYARSRASSRPHVPAYARPNYQSYAGPGDAPSSRSAATS